MSLTKYKFGDFICQRREKYNELENLPIWGVSKEGFISPKQDDADTSIYNVYYKYDFVFNPARMELNSIALNTEYDKAICSSLYEIFYITRPDIVLPEYLNIFIKRDEFARKCWFEAVGSARNYFRVTNLCEFEIELPSINIQRKYIAIYNAMLANKKSYEHGIDDLITCIDILMDKYKKISIKKSLGDFLMEVDCRNVDSIIKEIKGINIEKKFMPSVADSLGLDISKYKIVKKNQFAYSGMQTGRDECIRIALNKTDVPIIISPAYSVLKIYNTEVLPEYLMMWFSRKESDRRGWFMSDGSIRSNLDLDRFLETEIPIPSIEVQKALVDIYNVLNVRRELVEKLRGQIKNICPILIKGSIEEARKEA